MNLGVVAMFITLIFSTIKYALNYKEYDMKSNIQDTVMCFLSALCGGYLYDTYYDVQTPAKVTAVFTDVLKP